MPYRTVKALSPVDAAYMAGLIDGEGTVTLSRRHRTDQRQLVVSIANTERGLLEWTLDTVGAGKITGKRTSSPLHSPSFTYSIANRQALQLLEQIAPYLRSYKATRTQLILQNYISLTCVLDSYARRIGWNLPDEVTQFGQCAEVHKASRPACAHLARLDRGKCVDGHIDQSSLVFRQALRLIRDSRIAVTRKSRDGVGNGIVEATVEGGKFVYGNGCFLFNG